MNKCCFVPNCDNTSEKTPGKLFIEVPRNAQKRRQWYKVLKKKTKVSSSILYCCEDHFDLESDVENYLKYKLMGGRLKLKTGVLPHRCLGDDSYDDKLIREIKMEEVAIKTEFEHIINIQPVEIIKSEKDEDISSESVTGLSAIKSEFEHFIDIKPVEIIKSTNDEDITSESVTGPPVIKNEFDHLIDIQPVEIIKCANDEDIRPESVTETSIDIKPFKYIEKCDKAIQVDIKPEVSDQSTNTDRWSPEIKFTARIIRRKRKID